MTTLELIEKFEKITTYPLLKYFRDWNEFVLNQRQFIVSYYNGITNEPNQPAFKSLQSLLIEAQKIDVLISQFATVFATVDWWFLIDDIESMRTTLETTDNASRWLRSSINKNNFNPNPQVEWVLSVNQTLENVSSNVLQSTDFDNDWTEIALNNDLTEEEYTPEGGAKFFISFKNSAALRLNSVIDNAKGEKVYGLDIAKKFEFVQDESGYDDLKTLSYKPTIIQAAEILNTLRKGDNPEFPDDGLQVSLVAGSNIGTIAFPTIFRQLASGYNKDDTFKALSITEVRQDQDALFVEYTVQTRIDETLPPQTLSI